MEVPVSNNFGVLILESTDDTHPLIRLFLVTFSTNGPVCLNALCSRVNIYILIAKTRTSPENVFNEQDRHDQI